MNSLNLVESFAEFKEYKNINRPTMMRILEEVFRNTLLKKFDTDENFDVIVNVPPVSFIACAAFIARLWKICCICFGSTMIFGML